MADDRRRDDARPGDPAEGVRIIGAEEAAEAFERGDVAERRGTNLPRYGDRPARPPAGPKPALRFPLVADDDAETPSLRPAKGKRFDPRPPPAWDEPEAADAEDGDPWPAESTWGEAAWDDDPQADVVAWTRGETGAQPVVPSAEAPAEPGLTWAEDFVDENDPWDGSWDEPTGAVRWADDEVATAAAASGEQPRAGLSEEPTVDVPPDDEVAAAPPVDLGAPAPLDLTDTGDGPADEWAAFGASDDEEPRKGRGLFARRRGRDAGDDAPADVTGAGPAAADEDWSPIGEAPDAGPAATDEAWAAEVASAAGAAAQGDEADPAPDGGAGDDVDLTVVGAGPAATDDDGSIWASPESGVDATEAGTTEAGAGDDAAAPSPWGEPSWGADVVASDPSGEQPSTPLFDADGGWAGGEDDDEKVFDFADEPSGQVALPHWTEPGTGELPRVLSGGEAGPATSGSTPAVHWRGHDGAWSGDEDFADLTDDDDELLGALDTERPHEEDLYAFDELDEVGAEPAPPPPDHDEPGSRRIAPARPVPPVEHHDQGGVGRNLGVAVGVGLAAAVVALGALYVGSAVALVLVIAALVVGIGEYQAAAQRAGYHPASLLGLTCAALYPIAVYWKGIEAYPVLLVVTLGAALAWHLLGVDGDVRVVESVGVTLFGIAWVAGLGSFAGLLLAQQDGRGMFVTAVLAAVGYDVGGLFIGRTMGSRPISDASPNKTVEGLFGGMFTSLFVVVVVLGLFGLAPWDDLGAAAKIGLLAMLAAPLGDLCESLVKRDLGVKDMGNLLPEHGGVLDRFDGLLFVLPTVFFAAWFFQLAPF